MKNAVVLVMLTFAAAVEASEFHGNVAVVKTDAFWDQEAEAVYKKGWRENLAEWNKVGSDYPYHYLGSAKTMLFSVPPNLYGFRLSLKAPNRSFIRSNDLTRPIDDDREEEPVNQLCDFRFDVQPRSHFPSADDESCLVPCLRIARRDNPGLPAGAVFLTLPCVIT